MQPITEELIREIKELIVGAVHPEKIILFGSYAYGKWKDVSVAFITSIMRKGKVIYG